MKRTPAHLLRYFVTGLLAALPLAATIAIFAWAASFLIHWLGPDSAVGSVLVAIGFGVTGSEIVGYLLGVALIALVIVALGVLVEGLAKRGMAAGIGALVKRIPVVGTVYDVLQRMVDLFKRKDEAGAGAMSPVWLHFGGPGSTSVLGLLSSPQVSVVGGRRCLAVLVPTAPVPMGGALLFVPEEWVVPAELGVEALTSIYVSMGVTLPQHLQAAATLPAATVSPPASARSG